MVSNITIYKILLAILTITKLCHASWFFKEHKICDPANNNGLGTFTGFKITRKYKIETFMPTSMSFTSITHCNHGKADYEKGARISSSHDINWDQPFCMIKPNLGTKLRDLPQDTAENIDDRELEVELQRLSHLEDLDSLQTIQAINSMKGRKGGIHIDDRTSNSNDSTFVIQTRTKLRENLIPLKNLFINVFDSSLGKVIGTKRIKYFGTKELQHLQDLQQSSLHSSLEWESRNLACYKLARRRKYAKRDILYYMPHTFIGGLFECHIPTDLKIQIFQNLNNSNFLQMHDFHIKCDKSLSTPLQPLIADDSTRQWFERHGTSIIQTIPYLSTATPYNLRFKTSDTNDMYRHTWASDIDVNEDYNYSDFEVNLILQALASSANYLNKILMIRPIFKSGRLNSLHAYEDENEDIVNLNQKFQNFDSDHKLSLIMTSLSKPKEAIDILKNLQKLWDNSMNDTKQN